MQCLEQSELDAYKRTGIRVGGNFILSGSKKRSDLVADSTKTSDGVAVCATGAPLEFGRNLLLEVNLLSSFPSLMLNDNAATVINSSEGRLLPAMRHHGLKLAITMDRLEQGVMKLLFIAGLTNRADMMTKNEDTPLLQANRDAIMAEADTSTPTTIKDLTLHKKRPR